MPRPRKQAEAVTPKPEHVRQAVERIASKPAPHIDLTPHWDRGWFAAKWGVVAFGVLFAINLGIQANYDRQAGADVCAIELKPLSRTEACLEGPPARCGTMSKYEFMQAEIDRLEWIEFLDTICRRDKPRTVQAFAASLSTDGLQSALALIQEEKEASREAEMARMRPNHRRLAEEAGQGGPEVDTPPD